MQRNLAIIRKHFKLSILNLKNIDVLLSVHTYNIRLPKAREQIFYVSTLKGPISNNMQIMYF